MNDIYLGKRESNRGCYVLAIAALLIGLLAWFVFAYNPKNVTPADPNVTVSPDGSDPRIAPENPAGPGTQLPGGGVPPPPISPTDGTVVQRFDPNGPPPAPPPLTPAAPRRHQLQPDRVSIPPQPVKDVPETNAELTDYVKNARITLSRGDDLNARRWAVQAWNQTRSNITRRHAETVLDDIHRRVLAGQADLDEMKVHRVKRNEFLSTIAPRYGTTAKTIMLINNLDNPNRIRAGQELNIIEGNWNIEVDLSECTMILKLNGHYFKRYSVGVGRPGKETPIGEFIIRNKQPNPDWSKPGGGLIPFGDPRNELGTRWLGWDKDSYGIHGTNDPHTIGTACSSGCVRMQNGEVEELYDLVPYKTPVVVRP